MQRELFKTRLISIVSKPIKVLVVVVVIVVVVLSKKNIGPPKNVGQKCWSIVSVTAEIMRMRTNIARTYMLPEQMSP